MDPEILSSINRLKELDLSKYPYGEILTELNNLDSIGQIVVTLKPNKPIFRARMNDGDAHFSSKCELTYRPQHLNLSCQRASTPNMTMFYGSILPDNLQPGEMDITRATPIYETSAFLRDKNLKGIRKVTFSRWNVIHDLKLIAVLQHDKFYDKSNYTKKIMDEFRQFLDQNPDKKDESIEFTTFLSNEFAKTVKEDESYQYLISAAFSELVVKNGFDGVLYPSVKMDGKGFNVALTPFASDTKVILSVVVECTIYKHFDKAVLGNDLQAILYPNQTHFILKKIEEPFYSGPEECLKQLGLDSLDQLK